MNETQDEILARLIRIESKLSAFMEASGFDTHGVPLKKTQAEHPESLFTKGIYRDPARFSPKLFRRN